MCVVCFVEFYVLRLFHCNSLSLYISFLRCVMCEMFYVLWNVFGVKCVGKLCIVKCVCLNCVMYCTFCEVCHVFSAFSLVCVKKLVFRCPRWRPPPSLFLSIFHINRHCSIVNRAYFPIKMEKVKRWFKSYSDCSKYKIWLGFQHLEVFQ